MSFNTQVLQYRALRGGVNAFLLAETMGSEGRVVGLDASPGMLYVAGRCRLTPG